MDPEN